MKKIASVLVSLLLVASLCACGTPSQTSSSSDAPDAEAQSSSSTSSAASDAGTSDSGEAVEVVFWHNWGTGPSGRSIDESVADYNASQSKVVVSPLYVAAEGGDSITSKMITAVASGNPPESILSSRYGIAEYMDAVTILDDLVERDGIDLTKMYPWAVDEASYEGKLLAMPYDGTSRALYYNKDHFAAAGLDPEKPPTTIEELSDYAQKLTIKDGSRVSQYGFVPWYGQGWLYSWGWSFGGSFYDPASGLVTANDPKIVEALTWMTDVAKTTGVEAINTFTTSAGSDANDAFVLGQLSMQVQGNWFASQLEEFSPDLNYGVCNIPGPAGVAPTTFVGGRAIVIPKGVEGEKLDAAWDWVKWMCTSEEGQSKKLISYEYPVMMEISEKIYAGDPLMETFLSVLPNGKNRPVILAGNMMWDELGKTPEIVLSGSATPQEILDQITEKINAEVAAKKAAIQ